MFTNPSQDFVLGQALDLGQDLAPQSHRVQGWVRVEPNNGNDNVPTVLVNGQSASVSPLVFAEDCPVSAPFLCFQFEVTLDLNRGEHNIQANASDTKGNSYQTSIAGLVDICRKGGFDAGVASLFQADASASIVQNNRCHEVDGCSAYFTGTDPLAESQIRNDPASINNSMRSASTAFGSGEVPPNSEYFVHGQMPTDLLPCNIHDVCYQIAYGQSQSQCDSQMALDMDAVCERAYPGDCPAELSTLECLEWKGQRESCQAFADAYSLGLSTAGSLAFEDRRLEYRLP